MKEKICKTVFMLYLYADMTKMIHYSTEKNHIHELCDSVRDSIVNFADELAEQTFGFYGKPTFDEMSLNQPVHVTNDIGELCKHVIESIEYISTEYENDNEHSNIISLIDDFKGDLRKAIFLSTFDRVSGYKNNKK